MSSADSQVEVLTIRAPVSVAVISTIIRDSGALSTGLASPSAKKAAAAETARAGTQRVAVSSLNPQWLAPTGVTLLILGLAYLVTYYLSAGSLPLPIGDWNIAVGFGVLMVGGGVFMFWK